MGLTVEEVQKHTDALSEAMKQGDYTKLIAEYDESAVLMPNNEAVVRGIHDIEEWYKKRAEHNKEGKFQLKMTVEAVTDEDVHVFIRGSHEAFWEGNIVDTGKYLTVLKKVGDAHKVIYATWNTDTPMKIPGIPGHE